jgi:hypothetical protein
MAGDAELKLANKPDELRKYAADLREIARRRRAGEEPIVTASADELDQSADFAERLANDLEAWRRDPPKL